MSVSRSRVALLGLLYVGALLISAFTIRRGGAEFDEGLVLQAAARVADGQVPYRDFAWPYGPAHPYLLGAWFDALGPSMMSWRVVRVVVDAAVAVAVYVLARREGAPTWLAVGGWLLAACAMAQPTSANPFPPALLLALLAVTAAAAGRSTVLPAVATALAGAWRLDFALYAAAATVVALALRRDPAHERIREIVRFGATAVALVLLVYLPFAAIVGPADLYDSLVGTSMRERDYWTLPFPLDYGRSVTLWPPGAAVESLEDALDFYLPALAVAGFALAAIGAALAGRERRPSPATAGLIVLGIGGLAYLLSRADELHATPIIVVLAAVLPVLVARRRATPTVVTAGVAVVFAALALHGTTNRLSALLRPPDLVSLDVPVADGALVPPREGRALARVTAIVRRRVPPGQPIYTVTRRSDLVRFNQPLVYVVTDRPNPTRHDFAIQTSARAQRRLVAELERASPGAIVRWTDPMSTEREPNLRGRPTGARVLDRWIADRYVLLERVGYYDVLVPRDETGPRSPSVHRARPFPLG